MLCFSHLQIREFTLPELHGFYIFTRASSLQHKENEDLRDSPDWLHRNDNYIRRSHQMYGNNAFQQSTEILREPGASAFGEI
jgi:hypothetical protein